MSYVTQIGGNDIKDKELRDSMNNSLKHSISSINEKIELLRIAIMAIGQTVLGLCGVIEKLNDANAIKKKYLQTFRNAEGGASDDYDFGGVLDNLAVVLLNLAEFNLSYSYKVGEHGHVLERWENAIEVCQKASAHDYYYKVGDSESGQIERAVNGVENGNNSMHDLIAKTRGSYSDTTIYSDKNIF